MAKKSCDSNRDVIGCKCKLPPPNAESKRKKLVVCLDGSSNKFGLKNTNVVDLFSEIIQEDYEQLCYYSPGVGAFLELGSWYSPYTAKKVIFNEFDKAVAWTFDKNVMAAYRWLSNRYNDGDQIFLFGFSRGAYQVRILAGMIHEVGLIYKGNDEHIPFAYSLYTHQDSPAYKFVLPMKEEERNRLPESLQWSLRRKDNDCWWKTLWKKAPEIEVAIAARFKATFSRPDVRVHFVGVWDTVASLGVFGRKMPSLSCKHSCYFRHALALDEWRVKYLPEYVHGGMSCSQMCEVEGKRPNVKEVWFTGSHCDIGGGHRANLLLQDKLPSLYWMRDEAITAGLRFKPFGYSLDPRDAVLMKLSFMWNLMEYFLLFPHYTYNDATERSSLPHIRKGRRIVPEQKIHVSVAFQPDGKYSPKARLPEGEGFPNWNDIIQKGNALNFNNITWTRNAEKLIERGPLDLAELPHVIHELAAEKESLSLLDYLAGRALTQKGAEAILAYEDIVSRLAEIFNGAAPRSHTQEVIRLIITGLAKFCDITQWVREADQEDGAQLKVLKTLSSFASDDVLRAKLAQGPTIPICLFGILRDENRDATLKVKSLQMVSQLAPERDFRNALSSAKFSERLEGLDPYQLLTELAQHGDEPIKNEAARALALLTEPGEQ